MRPAKHLFRMCIVGMLLTGTCFADCNPDQDPDCVRQQDGAGIMTPKEPAPPAATPDSKKKPTSAEAQPQTPLSEKPAAQDRQITNEPPPQSPPPQTPPGETPQNNITGIRQGDVIIMRQNQEQVRVWNEQQDTKSMEARLNYEGRHGQQIQIEQPQGYTTPVVTGEVTDAQGNVWERVKVNAKDVPQFLDKSGDKIYVLSVGGPQQTSGKQLQSGEVTKDAETGKTLPQAITGAPAKPAETKVTAQVAPTTVTTFFKGLSDKMVEEGRAKDKERELASVEEEKKVEEKPLQPKPNNEIAVNNDIAIGSSGGVADMTATGNLATELFRLKKGAGTNSSFRTAADAQVMTASLAQTSGDKLGAEPKMAGPKRALASVVEHDGTRKTVKNLIAILAGIVTLFLFHELGLFGKIRVATTSASGGRASWLAGSQLLARLQKTVSTAKPNWIAGGKKKNSQATNATSATRMKSKQQG